MKLVCKTDYDAANPENRACSIFEAESASSDEEKMKTDPALNEGLMNAELDPFLIALRSVL